MAPKNTLSWRRACAYPAVIQEETRGLLDLLEELAPIPDGHGGRSSVLAWIQNSTQAGLLTPDEANAAETELRPTLHAKPDRYFLHLFLDGEDDLLLEDGECERLRETAAHRLEPETIRLVGGPWTATIIPLTRQKGVVRESNCLRKGAHILSRIPWNRAGHIRGTWTEDTFVHPKSLEIIASPSRLVA